MTFSRSWCVVRHDCSCFFSQHTDRIKYEEMKMRFHHAECFHEWCFLPEKPEQALLCGVIGMFTCTLLPKAIRAAWAVQLKKMTSQLISFSQRRIFSILHCSLVHKEHMCREKSDGIPYYKYPSTITNPGSPHLAFAYIRSRRLCNQAPRPGGVTQNAVRERAVPFLAALPFCQPFFRTSR